MCGRRGMPAWPEYSASKFALCGLTEALRGELARFDIDVLLIVPGLTRSELREHLLRNDGTDEDRVRQGHAAGGGGGRASLQRLAEQPDRDGPRQRRALDAAASTASSRGWSTG